MKAKDILALKGDNVLTCNVNDSLMAALGIFAENKVGSLLVLDSDKKISGIISPRDILLAVLNDPDSVKSLAVSDVMTKDLLVATPEDTVSYIQSIMTENRVRHMPIVLDNGTLAGIVSIGDVVKSQIDQKTVENHYLRDYIEGKYPG